MDDEIEWGTALRSEDGDIWNEFWCGSEQFARDDLAACDPSYYEPDVLVLVKRTKAKPAGPIIVVEGTGEG